MPRTRVPIGIFAPDGETVGSLALADIDNLLPVHKGYRLVPQPQLISTLDGTDPEPITGGYPHLVTAAESLQVARPIADANISNTAIVDQDGNEPDPTDDTLGIYRSIDEPTPDESDFIVSITDNTNDAFAYGCVLTPLADPTSSTSHVFRYRYKSTAAVLYQVTLDDGMGGGALTSWTDTGDDVWTLREHTLSAAEANSISDYTNLSLIFRSDEIAPTVTSKYPDATQGNSGNWTTDVGDEELHDHVGDPGNDAEYIVTPTMGAGGHNFFCTLGLPDLDDPVSPKEHALRLRAKYTGTDAATVTVKLRQNSTVISEHTFDLTDSFSTQTFDLDPDEIATITDYHQLWLVVQAINTGTTSGTVTISAVGLDLPQFGQFWLSWAEFECPLAGSGTVLDTDVNYQYVGTGSALYEVNPYYTWDDVSRAGGYAKSDDVPQSWSFTSWGSDIIATNYADEIQIKSPGANFTDLITSPASDEYEVRGRFVATVNNFLVVAGINPNSGGAGGTGTIGSTIGTSQTVWWSAINDNVSFKIIDLSTQSDYQPLVDTPGSITGLVGGSDYGLVLKRNSVTRMDYAGSDIVFSFHVISNSEGTAFPRSIVQVDSDVYFMGAGGIKVIRNGQRVDSIGDGVFSRWFTDGEFNDDALAQRSELDPRVTDSQIVGTYDPVTQCIYWLYTPTSVAGAYKKRLILVYNVKENRPSKLDIDDFIPAAAGYWVDHIMSLNNQAIGGAPATRLLQLYTFDNDTIHGLVQLNSPRHLSATLVTSIVDTATITNQVAEVANISIRGVRPLFELEGSNRPYPPITIQVESSNDPELRVSDSVTASYLDRDNDGWYPLGDLQSGEFFRFTAVLGTTPSQFKYFTHLELDWAPQGGN